MGLGQALCLLFEGFFLTKILYERCSDFLYRCLFAETEPDQMLFHQGSDEDFGSLAAQRFRIPHGVFNTWLRPCLATPP
jgi:hypothetical protein